MTAYATVWKRTDKHRLARRNEWYVGWSGHPVQCLESSTNVEVDIVQQQRVDPYDVMHEGDPCEHCGASYRAERCPGRIKNDILVEAP